MGAEQSYKKNMQYAVYTCIYIIYVLGHFGPPGKQL